MQCGVDSCREQTFLAPDRKNKHNFIKIQILYWCNSDNITFGLVFLLRGDLDEIRLKMYHM